jgi:hypothetical protein
MATGGAGGAGTSGATAGQGGFATAVINDNTLTAEQITPPSGMLGGAAYVNITGTSLAVGQPLGNTNTYALSLSGIGAVTMPGLIGSGSLLIAGPAVTLQLANFSGASEQTALVINSGSTLNLNNNHF